jgi:hypothetical protein
MRLSAVSRFGNLHLETLLRDSASAQQHGGIPVNRGLVLLAVVTIPAFLARLGIYAVGSESSDAGFGRSCVY